MNETKIVDEGLKPSGSKYVKFLKKSRSFGLSEPSMKQVQDLYNEMKEAEISEKALGDVDFLGKSKRGRV